MKFRENFGWLLLSTWLIATGLFSLLDIHNAIVSNVLPLVALLTGIFLLLGPTQLPKSMGIVLFAIWLIMKGLIPFVYFYIPYCDYLVDILGIIAGILLLIRR
jgi:hypothetical protein